VLKGGMGKKQRRTIAEAIAAVPESEPRVILAKGLDSEPAPKRRRTICSWPRSQNQVNGGRTDCCDVSSNRTSDALCPRPPDTICRRTAGDLLRLVYARVEERTRVLEAKRAAEAARRQKTRLTALAIWINWGSARKRLGIRLQRTSKNRQPNEFDKAITLLIDLRDLAVRQGQVAAFQSALGKLRRTHAAKESFLRRLIKAKL